MTTMYTRTRVCDLCNDSTDDREAHDVTARWWHVEINTATGRYVEATGERPVAKVARLDLCPACVEKHADLFALGQDPPPYKPPRKDPPTLEEAWVVVESWKRAMAEKVKRP